MTDSNSDDEEPTTWEDPRETATIHGEKKAIDEATRRKAERRREGL